MKKTYAPGITLKDDTWFIRVQFQRDGRNYDDKRRIDGIDLAKAKTIQAEMRVALEAKAVAEGATAKPDTQDFKTYLDTWCSHLVATGKARPQTIQVRKPILNTLLIAYFGALPITKITRKHISEWMAWVSTLRQTALVGKGRKNPNAGQPYSQDYLTSGWTHLCAAFSKAQDLINLPTNPTSGMEFSCLGAEPKKKSALTLDEVKALLWKMDATESVDITAMVWVGITSGMRFGELSSLTWADIDFDRLGISLTKSQARQKIGKTKNSLHRVAPLHPDAATKLKAWKAIQTASKVKNLLGLVFPSNTGTYRFPAVLFKPLARACLNTNIAKHISAHSLRRTCNNLVRIKCGDVAARAMLGHTTGMGEQASTSATDLTTAYSEVVLEELKAAQLKAFGSLVKPIASQETSPAPLLKVVG